MATIIAAQEPAPRRRPPFPLRSRWDRYFFPAYVALIWLGILAGFVPEILQHYRSNEAAYPRILHVHGAVFVSWLVLLTVQLFLIRSRQVQLHRRIGILGAALAIVMVPLGIVTALTIDHIHLSAGHGHPEFFSVQLFDMIEFGALAAAAISLRKSPSAHKRLVLLATLSIADAGFARWLGPYLDFGPGVLPLYAGLFLPTALLILGIGAYDLATRHRLHPIYVLGAAWIFAGQFTACWLYYSPAWKQAATTIIRSWPLA